MFYKNTLNRQRVNLADFSTRVGLKSRSYLSEVLSGKKILTKDSAVKISSALNLPWDYQKLFLILVRVDQMSKSDDRNGFNQAVSDLEKFKKTGFKKNKLNLDLIGADVSLNFFKTFAALGVVGEGATMREVLSRTKMEKERQLTVIEKMMSIGLISKKKDRYFASDKCVDLLDMRNKSLLSKVIRQKSNEITNRASLISESKYKHAFYCAQSIKAKDYSKIKNEIQNAVFSILDKYIDDEGSKIQEVFFVLE